MFRRIMNDMNAGVNLMDCKVYSVKKQDEQLKEITFFEEGRP